MQKFKILAISILILSPMFLILKAQCPGEVEVKVRVHTDSYGTETTWLLKHATDTTVYLSGGPYQNITGGQLYIQNVCVPQNTPLVFRINDSYGDGICCSYGQGYYEVEMFGYTYASGGQFASYEETFFTATPPPARDLGVTSLDVLDYYGQGNITIKGTVKNFGVDTVTSFTLNYSINQASAQSHQFTSAGISSFASSQFAFPIPYLATASGNYSIKVWVVSLNNNTDLNAANDTLTSSFMVLSQTPQKNVLLEQATGAWCGYCPDGALKVEEILLSNPNVIATSIHNGDAMSFTHGNTVNSTFVAGYPSGMIDRFKFSEFENVGFGRGFWNMKTSERAQHAAPVSVGVNNTYNPVSRVVTVTLTATFYANINKDLRFNCFIVEDSLSGSGSGWDQVNNYNNTSGHPMQGLGNPISGYVHRHVVRAMLGGAFGEQGSIPSSVNDGQTYTKIYTYTLPPGMKEKDVRIIGLVQQYNTDKNKRMVLNSKQMPLDGFANVRDLLFVDGLNIYPNPSNGYTNIVFNLSEAKETGIALFNVLGQKVYAHDAGLLWQGTHQHHIHTEGYAPGIYNCVITFGHETVSRKIIVN